MQAPSSLVCVGELTAPHGVRGLLRLRSFTADPAAVLSYALQRADGTAVKLQPRGMVKDFLLVAVDGVDTIEGAQALRGTRLYTPRADLPATAEGEYYLSDLVGLAAQTVDGAVAGQVVATHDFGAGLLLEIKPASQASFMLPFTDAFVPRVDIAGGVIDIVMPELVE